MHVGNDTALLIESPSQILNSLITKHSYGNGSEYWIPNSIENLRYAVGNETVHKRASDTRQLILP